MKSMVFAQRNFKEIIRDPISWIFCAAFPLVMLLLMTVINNSIPPEANMTIFGIESLAPGITIFGFTFIMLFAAMLVSGDRTEAFLLRVFTSPMKPSDYILGYILPLLLLCLCQALITGIVSAVAAAVSGNSLNLGNLLLSIIISLPAMMMFVSFGLLFGSLLHKNAAPGICSIIITFSGMLGGIWMDVDAIGGALAKICNALPFYHAVKCARLALSGDFAQSFGQTGIVAVWAIILTVLAILVFRKQMKY